MKLTYDADLVEGVAFLEARRLERGRGRLLAARYDRDRSRLYGIADPDERNTAFFRLHLDWFRDFGFEDRILSVLKQFPVITRRAALLLVRKAVSKKDEGAELFVRPDANNIAVALRCERFVSEVSRAGAPAPVRADYRGLASPVAGTTAGAVAPENRGDLDQFLRHEFCHISDMLDETFAYEPEITLPDAPPAELNLLRDRYRVLWDITIDGRLRQESEKPKRLAEFTKAFSHLTEQRRAELFEQLWGGLRPAHPELLGLAKAVRIQARNIPGAACPLCNFPTFQWAGDAEILPALVRAIQQHFPKWSPDHGCCSRCTELYSLQPLEQPATLFIGG